MPAHYKGVAYVRSHRYHVDPGSRARVRRLGAAVRSPEQKASALAKREKMKVITRAVSAMSPADRAALAQRAPIMNPEGRTLSVFNSCLVASQFPTATIVAGFRQWIRAGRGVRKGEHGFNLWVPIKRGEEEEVGARPGFILGTVFDVSQTDELTAAQLTAARRSADKRERAPRSLLAAIMAKGGIDIREMLDLTGDTKPTVRPGLFRHSGRGLDELATNLRSDGFDIPEDTADGGVQALRDMIRAEVDGIRKHHTFADTDRIMEQDHKMREEREAGMSDAGEDLRHALDELEPMLAAA